MKLLLAKSKEAGQDVAMQEDTYIRYHNRDKLCVLDIDDDFFKSYILQDNHSNESHVHTPSQRRLLEAKNFLCQWVEMHPNKVHEFVGKIENMKVLTYFGEPILWKNQ